MCPTSFHSIPRESRPTRSGVGWTDGRITYCKNALSVISTDVPEALLEEVRALRENSPLFDFSPCSIFKSTRNRQTTTRSVCYLYSSSSEQVCLLPSAITTRDPLSYSGQDRQAVTSCRKVFVQLQRCLVGIRKEPPVYVSASCFSSLLF
jgi:hypothetical protein